ncbi:MAG: hypothetical protein OXB86_00440 [Bdellovibrionales bacterium]|nr:hypothetical protein [Bdellovibrionales bacterium]
MKAKKISSKSVNKAFLVKKSVKKGSEPILLRKVNDVDKLFTKKDIKIIVDSVVGRNQF